MGNTILLTPLIQELEQLYPGAEIDVLAEGDIAEEVFSHFFSIKNVFCLPRRGFKHPVAFLSLLHSVRQTYYDLIIDPCLGSGFSRAMTLHMRGRFTLGFSDDRRGSGLTHAVPTDVAGKHMARRAIHLVRWACTEHTGQVQASASYPSLDIRLSSEERVQGLAALRQVLDEGERAADHPVVGIFANATGAKRYSSEWWAQFIQSFKSNCAASSIVELIPAHGHSMLGETCGGYYSSDIRRMGAVMANVDLMISADCGVMHLAVASKVPTVGLFSVTDASVYAPYGSGCCSLLTTGRSPQDAASQVVLSFASILGSPRQGGSRRDAPSNELGAGAHRQSHFDQLGLSI